MTLRNHHGLHVIVALGLLVSACGGNDGSDEAAETADTTATEAGTSDEVGTEAGETADTTATTEASTTDAETTDAETTDAETSVAETTDAETTDATTDATTDTGNMGCADIEDPDACAAMAGCQPVNGSKLKENGPDSPCLEPSGFLGCIAEQACGDALTWFCQGNGTFQVTDTCGPDGAEPCDGPADPVDACP